MDLLKKAILGTSITQVDIKNELYEICDKVHTSCDSGCPVYFLSKENPHYDRGEGCTCFKNGTDMLIYILSRIDEFKEWNG